MEILRGYKNCPESLKGAVLAIGNFDGVHRGHQAVIEAALEAGKATGAVSGAMTFEPHPRQFFQPDVPLFRLTSERLKVMLLGALGLDLVCVLPFNAALASLTAERFASEILADGLGVSHVVTGSDFHFGKGRGGDPEILGALGKKLGFSVTVVAPQAGKGGAYSSTQVREHLRQGEPREAADILGYWWRIAGTVVGGDKRGHGLGFPTANIAVPEGFGLKHGIYVVRAWVGSERYHGASYLGTRPSFDDGEPVIETFLFDFTGDLYDTELQIEVIDFLRGDEAFASPEALKAQMRVDCEMAKKRLVEIENGDPMQGFPLAGALIPA
jgi:riboflavin kinase/FMN adenylyltransferase